jgi:putative ABC transport system permease protein
MEGEAYVPYAQGLQSGPVAQMDLVLKTSSDPLQSAPRLRSIVSDLNPDVPVTQIRTMDEIISASVAAPRSSTFFLAAFAVLALLLGAVGIYGVIAYAVTQRTQEIGIRMALGAHSRDIRRMVLGQTLLLGATGITIGIGGALAATRALRSLLYGVSASDPATFLGVCVLLLAVAMLAGYLPARRATRIDPTIALRYE